MFVELLHRERYGACAAAVCVDADGAAGYGHMTVMDDGCSIDPAADAFCDDGKTCTEDICLAGNAASTLRIDALQLQQ